MGKGKQRLLAGMLGLSLLVGNIACAGIDAKAASLETEQQDLAIEDRSVTDVLESEMLEDGTESIEQEGEDDKEDTEEVNQKEESDEIDEENAAIGDIENSDDINKSEESAEDIQDTPDDELSLVTADDDIAHGTQGNVSWVIDKNGKLTVEGSGDFIESYSRAPWYSERDSIISANISLTDITYAAYMFYDCKNLTNINLKNFNTGKVTDMSCMFLNCNKLTELDLGNFDTSRVTNMGMMFYNCGNLTGLDLSNFDTCEVTNMSAMFSGCSNLERITLDSFNTSKVTNMSGMFSNCERLVDINLSNFDTHEVTDMQLMFNECNNLENINVDSFNTSKVKNMQLMFGGCRSLTSIKLSKFDTVNVTDMSLIFSECKNLENIDLNGFNTINVTDMRGMFHNCSSLTELKLSDFNTGKATYMSGMFYGCSSLKNIDISSFNTSNVTDMEEIFYGCSALTSIDVSKFNTSNAINMKFMFAGCGNLKNLDVSNFDTSKVTNMAGMFAGCSGLENLNVSNFDTSNVTEMGEIFSGYTVAPGMFAGCSSLKNLDVSNFNTSKVTNMACMFSGCSSLKSLDLSNFDTGNVIYMGYSSGSKYGMFGNCSELTSLDLSNFNAAKVINLSNMFNGCSSLTNLDLSSFNTSDVEDMQDMFAGCRNLTELDLSKFDTGRLIYASGCFDGCEKLLKIYTPYNISVEIDIYGTWQDADGNEYRSLPQNLPHSIVITKKTDYITASPYITATKTKTSYACGEALFIDDITVTHYDNNGNASTVTEYSTNADEIDMSVPGTKTLIISYNNLTATIKLTVTSGNKEGLKVEMKYPDKKYIYTGRAITPEIVVTNNGLLLTEGVEYTVKYSKNIKASDSAMITVTGKGNLSGSKSKKFTIEAKRLDNADVETDSDTALKVEGDYVTVCEGVKIAPVLFYGETKLNAKDFKVEDEYKTYKWKAENDGTVIKVTGSGNFTGERTLRVKVITKDKQSQNKLTVSLSNDAKKLIYNGQVQNIKEMGLLTIATKSMQDGLKEGEDYIIYYSDDIKNAGTKKFTVVGISDRCVGTVTKSYTIKAKKTELTVEFDKDSSGYAYVSTGTTIDDLIVKDGSVILAQGSDYKVSYSGNKKAGTAKFTVTGLGNYKGSRYKGSFSINPAALNNNPAYADGITEGLEITVGDKVFKKPGVYKSAPYMSINGILVKSSDYNVTYYLDNPMSNPDARLMDNKNNKVTNANGDTTVWVKIEGKRKGNYATNDNTCYAVASYKVRSKAESGSYDLSKAKVTFQDMEGKSVKKITYTGDPITGDDIKVVVTYKIGRENITLVEGRDYEMEFVNNVNKGKATLVLNGRDGQVKYVGSKTASFSIVANNMKNISKWFGGLF